MTYSDYERYKWETLAHLFHRFGIDGAWFEVRSIEQDSAEAQSALVRRVVLDLFDGGLIFAAYASREDGYNLADEEFVPVSREVLVTELDRPLDYVEPEDHLLWLIPTAKAEEVWQSLPPEAYLDPRSARREMRVRVSSEAAEFARSRGGEVYVWVGGTGFAHADTEPPLDEREWAEFEFDGILVRIACSAPRAAEWGIYFRPFPSAHLEASRS